MSLTLLTPAQELSICLLSNVFSSPLSHCSSVPLCLPAGLPEDECVHCDTGSSAKHHARLLADGVGAPMLLYHHAHQCCGEEQGEEGGRGKGWGGGREED